MLIQCWCPLVVGACHPELLRHCGPQDSNARVLGAESDHCAPLAAALKAGAPVALPIEPSFISGIGVGRILDEMWPLVRELIDGGVVASAKEVAAAIRLLYERHRIIAEGAGAAPVAAALAGRGGHGKIVCRDLGR